MDIRLNALEARALGCLIEKEMATPEYYPLSLNALTNACNQKNNRDPVMSASESGVQAALEELIRKGLASMRRDFGARVPKYSHKLSGTLTRTLDFSPRELAVLCELLVRGPQTPGELRTHASRLHPFADVADIERTLHELRDDAHGPYVVELARQAGRRETQWACLFIDAADDKTHRAAAAERADEDRIGALEAKVDALVREIAELRSQLAALREPG